MLNVVAIMGRLTWDPQMRQTPSGVAVAAFRVACDRGRKDAQGNMQADFVDVVCWRQTADFVCKYFQKGSLIAITGRLQSRNYTDKNGNNRSVTEIVANNVDFAGPKSTQADTSPAAPAPSMGNAHPEPSGAQMPELDDFAYIDNNDDLPF